MILADCPELKKIQWRCVVIDEAHRLKNRNCKLLEGLKLMALVSMSCPGSCESKGGQRCPYLAVRCPCQLLRPSARAESSLSEGKPPRTHQVPEAVPVMEGPLMDGALVPCSHHKFLLLLTHSRPYLPMPSHLCALPGRGLPGLAAQLGLLQRTEAVADHPCAASSGLGVPCTLQ